MSELLRCDECGYELVAGRDLRSGQKSNHFKKDMVACAGTWRAAEVHPRAHPPAEWYLAITKIGHNTFVVTQRDLHDVEVFSMTGTYASVERVLPLLLNTKAMP